MVRQMLLEYGWPAESRLIVGSWPLLATRTEGSCDVAEPRPCRRELLAGPKAERTGTWITDRAMGGVRDAEGGGEFAELLLTLIKTAGAPNHGLLTVKTADRNTSAGFDRVAHSATLRILLRLEVFQRDGLLFVTRGGFVFHGSFDVLVGID